jgi:hypothetical protein
VPCGPWIKALPARPELCNPPIHDTISSISGIRLLPVTADHSFVFKGLEENKVRIEKLGIYGVTLANHKVTTINLGWGTLRFYPLDLVLPRAHKKESPPPSTYCCFSGTFYTRNYVHYPPETLNSSKASPTSNTNSSVPHCPTTLMPIGHPSSSSSTCPCTFLSV